MKEVLSQLAQYGVIGVLATIVHIASALALHYFGNVPPLWANFLAFLSAFGVSYWGNWRWTFSAVASHLHALPKYFFLSLAGFLVNQTLVYLTAIQWQWPFVWSVIGVASVLLAIGFFISRFWVFTPEHPQVSVER